MPSKHHAADRNGSFLSRPFCSAPSFVAPLCQQLNVHMGARSPGAGSRVQTFSGRSRRADRGAPRLSGGGTVIEKGQLASCRSGCELTGEIWSEGLPEEKGMLGEMALHRTRALVAGKQGQDEGTARNKEATHGEGGGEGGG